MASVVQNLSLGVEFKTAVAELENITNLLGAGEMTPAGAVEWLEAREALREIASISHTAEPDSNAPAPEAMPIQDLSAFLNEGVDNLRSVTTRMGQSESVFVATLGGADTLPMSNSAVLSLRSEGDIEDDIINAMTDGIPVADARRLSPLEQASMEWTLIQAETSENP